MASPYASFNGVPFDWGANMPQRQLKNGVATYSGTIVIYSGADFESLWALRAIVNVQPIGDGTQRVYIDSWQDPATIQHLLSMSNGAETHTAILSEFEMDQRYWSAAGGAPAILAVSAKAEFILLT